MKKYNKKIKLIIVIIVITLTITILPITKVNADTIMYMYCDFADDIDMNHYFTLTGKYGLIASFLQFSDKGSSLIAISLRDCWGDSETYANDDDYDCSIDNVMDNYLSGICPEKIFGPYFVIPVGTTSASSDTIKKIKNSKIAFYITDKNEIYGYSFDKTGYFSYLSSKKNKFGEVYDIYTFGSTVTGGKFYTYNMVAGYLDEKSGFNNTTKMQLTLIAYLNNDPEYYNKIENLDESEFGKKIFDSEDSTGYLNNKLNEWLNTEGVKEVVTFQGETRDQIEEKNILLETSKEFNKKSSEGKNYIFTSSYSVEQFLGDLIETYSLINKTLGENGSLNYYMLNSEHQDSGTSDRVQAFYRYLIKEITTGKVTSEYDDDFYVGFEEFYQDNALTVMKPVLNEVIEKVMNKSGKFDFLTDEEVIERLSYFMDSAAYLQHYKDDYSININTLYTYISESEIRKILGDKFDGSVDSIFDGLRSLYEELGESKNLYSVTDCTGLLSQRFIDKIKPYVNIVKIAIPILLILFGIIDFSKAIFANDQEKMAAAQKVFIKRLAIAIIIFVVPTLLELLLELANKVWPFIIPDTCGF